MRGSAADRPRLLVLGGPTAAGKSSLALALCDALGGELISADSVQIYRGLDIGSAKPSAAERDRIPHHALDLLEPTEPSDAGRWRQAAVAAIEDVAARGGVPVVCGGTGLYLRALLRGLAAIPPISPATREAVALDLASAGPEALHRRLTGIDPRAAARIAPRDGQRIGRALEVYRETGRPLSAWQGDHGFGEVAYDALLLCAWPERELLHQRIDARAHGMVAAGVVDEVRGLLEAGVPPDAPGLRTLGYREVVDHLARGEADGPEVLARRIALGHRRYAKRQLTWFRRTLAEEPGARHLDPLAADALARALEWWSESAN